MKKVYSIITIIVYFFTLINKGYSQTNHVTVSLQNCAQTSSSTMEFDIYAVSDGSSGSDLRANAFQFGINYNTGILPSGATITTSYINLSSNFIPPLSNFSFPASAYANHIRIIESAYTGGNTGNTMIVGQQYKVGRFQLTSSANWVAASNPNFNLQDTVVAGKTSCGVVVWVGTAVTTSAAPHSVSVACGISLNCTSCPPGASFLPQNSHFCSGSGCVNFTDFSFGSPTSWQWSFPGATPSSSTSQNPANICYSAPGTYSVALIVTNSFGSDTLTIPSAIIVGNGPAAPTITLTGDTLHCPPATSYQWYYNGNPISGATDSIYIATQVGGYKVEITNSSSCPVFSNTININVICNFSVSATTHNATCGSCNNGLAIAKLLNGKSPYTITWYTSPLQQGDSARNLLPGTYTVCAVDANGCTSCDYSVYIDSTNCTGYSIKTSSANATCVSCLDGKASVTATGGQSPYQYSWNTVPVQTTATAVNLSKGTYTVCVSDKSGCTACSSATVSVGYCAAGFSINPDTVPHHYIAVNTTIGAPPISYLWNWGDNSTDTGAYPTHTYASAAFYKICLSITDFAGCTSNYCDSFYLLAPSGAGIIYIKVVPPLVTSVPNEKNDPQLILLPNPATDKINVYGIKFTGDAILNIYNMIGEKVYTEQTRTQNSKLRTEVDVSGFKKGIYFVELQSEREKLVAKFVKN